MPVSRAIGGSVVVVVVVLDGGAVVPDAVVELVVPVSAIAPGVLPSVTGTASGSVVDGGSVVDVVVVWVVVRAGSGRARSERDRHQRGHHAVCAVDVPHRAGLAVVEHHPVHPSSLVAICRADARRTH